MPKLSDIVGQDPAIQVLRRAVTSRKLAHAYLFTGPEGVGKATCAIALASALNCLEAFGEGCDTCDSCHKIQHGLHPDLMHIQPDGILIKIDQVRVLERHMGFSPHEGRYRLVLIDEAEKLNLNAANALLKSVEEPRPRTLFVLVSSAGHRVAPTLVSRCQRVRFLPLSAGDVADVVEQHSPDASGEDRRAAAALSEGSAKRALRLLEGDQMAFIQRTIRALWQAGSRPSGSALEIFEPASEAGKDRRLLSEALDLLRVWLRDVLLCHEEVGRPERLVNVDRIEELHAEAARLPRVAIVGQLKALEEAQSALRGNVHPTLALENLCLSMRRVSVT